ncbi:MAG: carboxypeptidase regulatory-like domain-containing protein [Armatimonadota bacterium]|nr:carboxypeptidase regulatory-like domain-containing protein [Armatimonadota bacterium]
MQPQLIPQLSQRIEVTITDVAGEQVLVEDTIQRPDAEPWTVQRTYEGVPTSDDALLSALAYPGREPTGEEVAQARGAMHIVIPCAGVAYPLEGEAGDPIELVLASTVVEVRVRPDPATVAVGMTREMTATARNAEGQTVLVPGFDWSTSNDNATVDAEGVVTGAAMGSCEVTATETESGVSGSATVDVICNPPQIGQTALATDPDPMTAAGGTATIGALITDDRGVASATVIVTKPDESTEEVPMELTAGDATSGTWSAVYDLPANETAQAQQYSFSVTATDTDDCSPEPADAGSVTVPRPPVISGTVTGFLVNPEQTDPWPHVVVRVQETGQWTRTGDDGTFSFLVPPNATYTVTAGKKQHTVYHPPEGSHTVPVGTEDVSGVDFVLTPTPFAMGAGRAHGFVLDGSGNPVEAVTVEADGFSDTTDANGEYAIELTPETYTFTPSGGGYSFDPTSREADVAAGALTHVEDFTATGGS